MKRFIHITWHVDIEIHNTHKLYISEENVKYFKISHTK